MAACWAEQRECGFGRELISGAQAHEQCGAAVIAGLAGVCGGRVLREGYAQVSFLGARWVMY